MEPNNIPQYPAPAPRSPLTIPVAIIIAGAIVAGAVIWTKKPAQVAVNTDKQQAAALNGETQPIAPITDKDHILGNPNAKIKIVEYSDPSCPFCKMFHPTMIKIMDTYGKTGDVAWVYRHFPLDKPDANGNVLHKNAGHEAQALECAAQLGGNDKFWAYTNRLYSITPSVTGATPDGLDQAELPNIATTVGLNRAAFVSCLESGKTKDLVEADYLDGINAGVGGTPFNFIISPSGEQIPMDGARPYESVKNAIDSLLASAK